MFMLEWKLPTLSYQIKVNIRVVPLGVMNAIKIPDLSKYIFQYEVLVNWQPWCLLSLSLVLGQWDITYLLEWHWLSKWTNGH